MVACRADASHERQQLALPAMVITSIVIAYFGFPFLAPKIKKF